MPTDAQQHATNGNGNGNGNGKANGKPAAETKQAPPLEPRRLQRVAEVRRSEGLSRRAVARQLGVTISEIRERENPAADMPLSELYRWQEILGVPLVELLAEPDDGLGQPLQLRAQLLRVMKTVRTIQEEARQTSVRRFAETLAEQLIEIMPELQETERWPKVGRRRPHSELGQTFVRRFILGRLDDKEPSSE